MYHVRICPGFASHSRFSIHLALTQAASDLLTMSILKKIPPDRHPRICHSQMSQFIQRPRKTNIEPWEFNLVDISGVQCPWAARKEMFTERRAGKEHPVSRTRPAIGRRIFAHSNSPVLFAHDVANVRSVIYVSYAYLPRNLRWSGHRSSNVDHAKPGSDTAPARSVTWT